MTVSLTEAMSKDYEPNRALVWKDAQGDTLWYDHGRGGWVGAWAPDFVPRAWPMFRSTPLYPITAQPKPDRPAIEHSAFEPAPVPPTTVTFPPPLPMTMKAMNVLHAELTARGFSALEAERIIATVLTDGRE